jgi:thiopurine S-methyltransferase
MEPDFWHERWASNQIGFHEGQVNPLLVGHFEALQLPKDARVFLPLCGKTLDIDWLLSRGCRVVGAELSPLAAMQVFERLAMSPQSHRFGSLERRSAAKLDVFVGDIFDLTAGMLGPVDAVYDRAALIALPPELRRRYAKHLLVLAPAAPQLLITLDYDQRLMNGPPFSVPAAEVRDLYADHSAELLSQQDVAGGLKGKCPATESAWMLRIPR